MAARATATSSTRTGRSSPYDAETGEPLSELCVRFPDRESLGDGAGEWLPGADDVLAKWMALRSDERTLISEANLHRLGVQLDPDMVRRDLATALALKAAS